MTRRAWMRLGLLSLVACLAGATAAGEVTITFYHTSDLHEHAGPLARIAGFVRQQRAARRNVLFLDTGDWFNKGDLTDLGTRGEAMAALMGAMGYDALIPGNHDYSHGTRRLAELIDRYELPVTATNCTWPDAPPRRLKPYRTFTLDGVTVALIGTATPNMAGAADRLLQVHPIAPAVGELLPKLEGIANIMVLMTHVGVAEDQGLVGALPRIDLLFGGHDHRRFDKLTLDDKGKAILQHSGSLGDSIGEVVVTWDGQRIVGRQARLVKVTPEMPECPKVAAIQAKYAPP
ncbi:MAG TPA: metallophosphoesterase [Planctomycetota bacterium]|nr:metallophosphoesterase [Planctomycetota bacterium]HRR80298.1 metallophosphoesterase [Planctomycetota bacterium]